MIDRVQLAGSTTWRIVDDALYFHNDRVLKIEPCPPGAELLLARLERGATGTDLRDAWRGEPEALAGLLALLRRLKIVVPAVDPAWRGTAVERQVLWLAACGVDGDAAQRRLAASHVGVWGVGGIGAAALQHLAGAGVRRFTLLDYDRVCLHNLNRQFIYPRDRAGAPKVEAAAAWLAATYPDTQVSMRALRIDAVEALLAVHHEAPWDLLLVAADEPVGAVYDIAAGFCEQAGVPVLGASCGFDTGTWGPLLRPADVPAWRSMTRGPGAAAGVPPAQRPMQASFGPTNGLVASLLARDAVLHLAGLPVQSDRHLMTIDLRTLRIDAAMIASDRSSSDA